MGPFGSCRIMKQCNMGMFYHRGLKLENNVQNRMGKAGPAYNRLTKAVNGDSVNEECSSDFQKVMGCLSFATGKAKEPTKDCCSAVQNIKESDPKCLCFIMQQTHNGSAQVKSLGIQEAKLFQLPTACQLKNASLSFCPKLLGISPNSPDAAIFTNASTSATPGASSTGTSQPEKAGDSSGILQRPHLAGLLMIVAAIFIFAFPAGSAFMFHKCVHVCAGVSHLFDRNYGVCQLNSDDCSLIIQKLEAFLVKSLFRSKDGQQNGKYERNLQEILCCNEKKSGLAIFYTPRFFMPLS
ncbi:unnamed protein product [Dovyalis caffra]|uniref:Bifunctional inhibitor/plant lipid transfer protein/seed storage helical domain-containing protein n=1 Tax=Dovyalis caffra TaxID=77055 RepID=A0AAV1RHE0_9ROSI|nr:unnamed protein product [Dovyalis caffra]